MRGGIGRQPYNLRAVASGIGPDRARVSRCLAMTAANDKERSRERFGDVPPPPPDGPP